MRISQLRRHLYTAAKILGDVQAIKSGSPTKMKRRLENRIIGRYAVSKIWRR